MDKLIKISDRLEKEIADSNSRCLSDFPVEEYISAVDRWPENLCYNYKSPEILEIDARILSVSGKVVLETYHQLALIYLIAAAEGKIAASDLPSSVREAYAESFARIVGEIESGKRIPGRYLMTNPPWTPYWEYLGLTALKIIPAGIRLMIPERVTVQESPLKPHASQLCPGGKETWVYNTHVHPMPARVPGMFNREEFERSLRLSAAMLEIREGYVALMGRSWIYDPRLPDVSPRFSYLPDLLRDIGAILYRVGSDDKIVQQATQASPTRKMLYQEGKYLPTAYTAICPRDDLIRWARSTES